MFSLRFSLFQFYPGGDAKGAIVLPVQPAPQALGDHQAPRGFRESREMKDPPALLVLSDPQDLRPNDLKFLTKQKKRISDPTSVIDFYIFSLNTAADYLSNLFFSSNHILDGLISKP